VGKNRVAPPTQVHELATLSAIQSFSGVFAMNCAACGKYIGEGKNISREPESCGERECDTEVRDMYRQMDDEARERARDDDYGAYR
jgi:hypothetical protein